ncbi:hypothetical protein GX586_06450, partial [bacterium]|nr:hypothetical protein [bacterium]
MASPTSDTPLCISGIYPHLALFNGPDEGECGIGAIVPWAGKLWAITYGPHFPHGSPDKLWAIDKDLRLEARPESVGGTPACRMVHRESSQLFIGPYAIHSSGAVRTIDITKLAGRQTAVARHLTDPANLVYYFDMEGAVYEVNVHSLSVTKLPFGNMAPGIHGKGAYTGQGRFIIANNGEAGEPVPGHEDDMGVLAEWNGAEWRIIERKQFTDVTGPGGINGAPRCNSPVWSIGWDRRSVILKLLDAGTWHTFRLPKGNRTYDHRGGWYTEWPRIREVTGGKFLMDMHALFYDFPGTFSAGNTAGITPIASHHRYIPDFCGWNGRLVLASDDTSIMQNPMAGRSQSNLWFGAWDDLASFGPRNGYGGVWVNDAVRAGIPSDPYLINGFDHRVIHLWHDAAAPVTFTIEADAAGSGAWRTHIEVAVPARGSSWHMLPESLRAQWVRVRAGRDCTAGAFLHCQSRRPRNEHERRIFDAIPDAGDACRTVAGIIRPGADKELQYVRQAAGEPGRYCELDEALAFSSPAGDRSDEVMRLAPVTRDFDIDDASVIMTASGRRFRLPKGHAAFDKPFAAGWPRGIRECESERYLANIHGTFYVIGRESGVPAIQPVATHNKQIMDYCTWRGLLVMSGTRPGARPDGHYFGDGACGLWFGQIDDVWKLGKPVGTGGPWRNTPVLAARPSDPYLMIGYDSKSLEVSHDAPHAVTFNVEVDVIGTGSDWLPYATLTV